jgi:hypothetical protein
MKPSYYKSEKEIVMLLIKANSKRHCPIAARVIARLFASIEGGV